MLTMNEAQTRDSRSKGARVGRYFTGASPVLRAFAWLSVVGLLAAWAEMALSYFGVWPHSSLGAWFGGALLIAFVSGISSFCPLGGISAALVVLTLLVLLMYGSGAASA
jgi:hypothetical protein